MDERDQTTLTGFVRLLGLGTELTSIRKSLLDTYGQLEVQLNNLYQTVLGEDNPLEISPIDYDAYLRRLIDDGMEILPAIYEDFVASGVVRAHLEALLLDVSGRSLLRQSDHEFIDGLIDMLKLDAALFESEHDVSNYISCEIDCLLSTIVAREETLRISEAIQVAVIILPMTW